MAILKAITILIAVLLAAFTLEAIMMLSRPLPHHLQELLMRAQQERQQQDQQLQSGQSGHSGQLPIEFPLWLPNDKASLVVTAVFSIITIAYSCLTMVLESRRPPEGLDTSKSKPLIVIFSEIIASIVWAQILSVTIYIYIWTFGCAEPGERPLEMLWRLSNGLSSITSSTPLPPSSSTNSTLSSTTSSIPPSTMTVLAAIVDENRDLMDRICRRQGAMAGLEFMLVLLLIWNFYTNLAKNFQFIRAVSRS
ncbi:hypothetical protein BGW38_004511 [Lunasporangiospora selenospora]|uniref:Uncharacterized protein n=1 Tax=Lunasporangiospora selenospora TaxID=979761 RepID=A0A9P6FP71_9FUNG|nr:hypothetical protein BGW38_004511 [Lunasporangiospora selenospora]